MARDDEPRIADTRSDRPGGVMGRREVLLGGALLAASGVAFARLPRTPRRLIGDRKLEDLVPKTIGKWQFETTSGLVLPPSDQLSEKIYSQLLTRQYTASDGSAVMLLIAYSGSQDGVIQVHRPEVCYPASGYRLVSNQPADVLLGNGIDVASRFIIAERDLRREQLLYWTRLGSYFPTTWAEQRTAVIRENLNGIIPDGMLLRISSIGDGDVSSLLSGFATDLFGAVGPVMRQVMIGTGRA